MEVSMQVSFDARWRTRSPDSCVTLPALSEGDRPGTEEWRKLGQLYNSQRAMQGHKEEQEAENNKEGYVEAETDALANSAAARVGYSSLV